MPTGPARRAGHRAVVPAALAAAVLALSLGATGLAWHASRTSVERKLRDNFEFRVRDAEARILERLRWYEQALRGAAGLASASPELDRAAFRRYLAALDLQRGAPGIQALGLQRLVPAEALAAHTAALRAEGLVDYAVRPPGRRARYAPVVYLEPSSGPNLEVLGFDPLAEPTRRQAMERACDEGGTALSGKVTLAQATEAEARPAAVLYLPLYRGGKAPEDLEARRQALSGWVYAAFEVPELMAGLLGERAGDLDVELFDGDEPTPAGELYNPDGVVFARGHPESRFQALRPVEFGGHRWTLAVRSLGHFEVRLGGDRPRLVAASGLAASLLLAALTWLLATSRDRVQAALQRSESLHQLLMRNFPNGAVGLYDQGLRVLLADGAETAGLAPPAAWVGLTVPALFPAPQRPACEQACRAALQGRAVKQELRVAERVLEVTFHPVHGRAGQVFLGVVMTQDVTERRALLAQRSVAARLAAMGTLVAGVAHEINNPLAGQTCSETLAVEALERARQLLGGPGPPDVAALARLLDEARQEVAEALVGSNRIARVVKDLAVFGRPDEARRRVRLADAVEQALRWSTGRARPEVAIRVEIGEPPDVMATPGQLEQVMMNLLSNAIRAVPEGQVGTVTIRAGPGEGGTAILEVQDTGRGIDPAVAERIFDPFFTTHDVGQGFGLGLSVCHAIVTAHGGTIEVTSAPGQGSTFSIELPAAPPG